MSYILWAHVVGIFCFALIRAYSVSQAAMYAGVIAVFAVLGRVEVHHRKFASAMNALGLVTCSAILVDLSGGAIEMHFHFFVMVGILTLYQDWVPFLLAIGFVVLHHAVLGVLDPRAVYDHASAINNPVGWALIHGVFVLAASVTSVVAWKLNEEGAFRDALTRLPNRALFQDRVTHALARADRRPGMLAVLFVDLDGFKDVNDSLGHAAGDQLLCRVAERLRGCVRAADTAARLGGDEFAILVEDIDTEADALAIAQRILDTLAVPFEVVGRETKVSASVGVALNNSFDTVDELLRNADVAMYTVKDTGKARYGVFVPEMHAAVVDRVELAHELAQACDNDELRLYYQPIISFTTGQLAGVEALLRWEHPTRGLLLPGDFLQMAESTGAIVPIGAWVLETACVQARRWKDRLADRPFKVSVNLSPTQVFQEDVVATVAGALAHSGLDAADLVLELTEEVMVKDKDLAAERLQDLTALGVRLAVDDFGTGYSSLSYLQQLPFSVLKIDRSFIQRIAAGPKESLLASVIVDLAARMGLWTVAEGVEEEDQARALSSLGCDAAQGYAFARPVPADQIDGVIDGVTHSTIWFDRQDGSVTAMQEPAHAPSAEAAVVPDR
ncbi:MAG: EAL domain-containing protein [Acidimicrobiia bacterium]|nr:EAL domain-containing protein [Acidimicrobiia bacterium]